MSDNKNVILYCRVSSDEQKEGCSLEMQERFLRAYCDSRQYHILEVYHEDFSAKSWRLDRPIFRDVYLYCKQHSSEVGKVLFLRWDRFSRNLEFALTYKRKFVDELGIEINAIESPIDFNGAEWSTLLGLYCGVAHTEDIKISRRTRDGIHGTLLSGRCSNHAPRGYKNVRHAKHDTEVVIDPATSPLIKDVFAEVAKGIDSIDKVRRTMTPHISRTSFYNMLTNTFYIGLIHVPEYGGDPDQYVQGLHQPLIDKHTFEKVQDVVNGRKRKQQKVKNKIPHPDFFLRGYLLCPVCGYAITASNSKGRHGRKYAYYHCCHDQRHLRMKAADLIDCFIRFIGHLKPSDEVLSLYESVLIDIHKDDKRALQKQIDNLQTEIGEFEGKINRVHDLFIEGELDKKEKTELVSRYQKEVDDRLRRIQLLKSCCQRDIKDKLHYAISLISNLEILMEEAPTYVKQGILGSIFPQKLYFDKNKYRTPFLNSVVKIIYQETKSLRGSKKEKEDSKNWMSSSVPREEL